MANTCAVYQVPGPRGSTGAAGVDGVDGANAFTHASAEFTMPAVGGQVTVSVQDSSWFVVGQIVIVGSDSGNLGDSVAKGYMSVYSIPSSTQVALANLGYDGNAPAGIVFAQGTQISPAGVKGEDGADGVSGAPDSSPYVITYSDPTLTNSFNLGGLSDGLVKLTVAGSVATPAIAVADTDYAVPTAASKALAAVSPAANYAPYFTSGVAAGVYSLTPYSITLLAQTSNTNARSNLGLGTMATQSSSAVSITGGTLAGVTWSQPKFSVGTNSSLVNGANANLDPTTYTILRITTGPTGAFSISGITPGSTGQMLILVNSTGQAMTLSHESGSASSATYRITCTTGADMITTGNGAVILVYDGTATRWQIISFEA
jgi:hypothetical protein